MKKYLVIIDYGSGEKCSSLYEGEEAMLRAVQDRALSELDVYEVVKKVKLSTQPRIVMED